MNNPSSTSSIVNHIRQGEKRKRDSEHQLPPPQNIGPAAAATRSRIVEILASTANGCLSELGYFPGISARLKELEAQNGKWRDENVKLFQDNQRLLEIVRTQNATLKLGNTPDLDKLQTITNLEIEISRLKTERDELRQLLPHGAPDQQLQYQYNKLFEGYKKLNDSYRIAYHEVQRLNEQLRVAAGGQSQQRAPYPPQSIQSHSMPQHSPMGVPPIQSQQPPFTLVTHTQGQQPVSSPTNNPLPQPFVHVNQGQRGELSQTQSAIAQYRQRPSPNPSSNTIGPAMYSVPSQVPQGGNPLSFTPAPQQAQTAPNHAVSRQGSVGFTMFTNSIPPTRRLSPNMSNNPTQSVQPISNAGHASNPSTPHPINPIGNPSPIFESAQSAPTQMHSSLGPATRTRSAPLPDLGMARNQSPKVEVPPSPSSASNILEQNSLLIPSSPIVQSSPLHPGLTQPASTTISPRDSYLNTPQSTSPQPLQFGPPETPIQNGSTPYVPPVQSSSLNHGSSELLTKSQEIFSQDRHIDLPVEQENAPLPVPPVEQRPEQAPASEDLNLMQVDAADGGEESEEEMELGPDGLRLVKDCLEHIFHESAEGQFICRLCEHRYKGNIVPDPPVPFVNATEAQLEAHCIQEHQYAWAELRSPE